MDAIRDALRQHYIEEIGAFLDRQTAQGMFKDDIPSTISHEQSEQAGVEAVDNSCVCCGDEVTMATVIKTPCGHLWCISGSRQSVHYGI